MKNQHIIASTASSNTLKSDAVLTKHHVLCSPQDCPIQLARCNEDILAESAIKCYCKEGLSQD